MYATKRFQKMVLLRLMDAKRATYLFGALAGFVFVYAVYSWTNTCDGNADMWCSSRAWAEKCNVVGRCFPESNEKGFPPSALVQIKNGKVATVNEMVGITVLYETHCGDSIQFVTELLKLNERLVGLNIELVPWGKADGDLVRGFSCQHGTEECEANILQNCVLAIADRPSAFKFIRCHLERPDFSNEKIIQQCGADVDSKGEISACAFGRKGKSLMAAAGARTAELAGGVGLAGPPSFVPHVLINGKPNNKVVDNLKHVLCDEYKICPVE